MIDHPMDVRTLYEIRKTKKQKTAFLAAVTAYAQRHHYTTRIETGKGGCRNILFGDPEKAEYLITAHYDTPASIGLPNLITPNNPVSFVLIQTLLVGVLLLFSCGAAAVVYWLTQNKIAALLTWYVIYFGLLLLMLRGPANRHNANDNTSGVITVLEIMASMPESKRNIVCFILFDLEEAGLIGSSSYRKEHKTATDRQIVLNLDCVGDGDVIQFTPTKSARKNKELLQSISGICGKFGKKELRLRDKGFTAGSSDHKKFPNGVGIMAFHYRKGIGLYCGRIHTWRDIILEQTNIHILRAAIISLITARKE